MTKLEEGKSYIQVSAWHTELLCSHGRAFAFGENIVTHDALSRPWTRGRHTPGLCGWSTVLLRSDGGAVACGEHLDIRLLEEGQSCPDRFLQSFPGQVYSASTK